MIMIMISRLRKKMAAEGKISLDFRSYSSKDGGILWVSRFLQIWY
jgi:hypothetical protein